MENLYCETDNIVTWEGMKDGETGAYINADVDSVIMTLCHKDPLNPPSAEEGVSEVQTLVPDAAATGGNFTLSYEGETTSNIAYNASFATIKAALETLSTVNTDEIQPGGNLLTADPANGGMTFTFASKYGDTDLLNFDFSGMTGPTNAGSSISETTKGVLSGEILYETGTTFSIPLEAHNIKQAGIYLHLNGFDNYNDEYYVMSLKKNRVILFGSHTAETCKGTEEVYVGIENGCQIALNYVAGTDGNHRGILPDTLKNLFLYSSKQTVSQGLVETGKFYLFIEAKKGTSRTTKRIPMQAVYDT